MENASKALIIAGSILVAILLISLGIILIRQGNSVTDSAGDSMESINDQTYNSKYVNYDGQTVEYSKAKEISASAAKDGITVTGTLTPGNMYTVDLTYTAGRVSAITFTVDT